MKRLFFPVVGVLRVGAPTAPEVVLRLNLMVKASSCVEPGSSFSAPQCSGKGNCVTQPSEVRRNKNLIISSMRRLRREKKSCKSYRGWQISAWNLKRPDIQRLMFTSSASGFSSLGVR